MVHFRRFKLGGGAAYIYIYIYGASAGDDVRNGKTLFPFSMTKTPKREIGD